MTNKIRVTAVSYLNTKPLLYGIFKSPVAGQIDLSLDIPSECARKLREGEADLGLVPVAIIPELNTPFLVSDYCIGAVGAVRTVCIYGDCPIEEMEAIYLDYHSRTSVELTKLLLEQYWKLSPRLLAATPGYEQLIGGKTGGLIIGDRTVGLESKFAYSYDLASAWQDHTGLPFVFAAWVSPYPLAADFVQAFNKALKQGVEEIPQLIYLIPPPHPDFDLADYYTHHISYQLDEPKRQALQVFLEYLGAQMPPSLSAVANAEVL